MPPQGAPAEEESYHLLKRSQACKLPLITMTPKTWKLLTPSAKMVRCIKDHRNKEASSDFKVGG